VKTCSGLSEENGEDGVDFITVHCGVSGEAFPVLTRKDVSSGHCKQGRVYYEKLDVIQ